MEKGTDFNGNDVGRKMTREITDEYMKKVSFMSDSRSGIVKSGTWTVNTTAAITIPATCNGFRIYPTNYSVRFAVDESPVASGSSDFAVGGVCKNDMWETRLVQDNGLAKTLNLLSTVSTVVEVEIF